MREVCQLFRDLSQVTSIFTVSAQAASRYPLCDVGAPAQVIIECAAEFAIHAPPQRRHCGREAGEFGLLKASLLDAVPSLWFRSVANVLSDFRGGDPGQSHAAG